MVLPCDIEKIILSFARSMELGTTLATWEQILEDHEFVFHIPFPGSAEWNLFEDPQLSFSEVFLQHLSLTIELILQLFTLMISPRYLPLWGGYCTSFNQKLQVHLAVDYVVPYVLHCARSEMVWTLMHPFDKLALAENLFGLLKSGLATDLDNEHMVEHIKFMAVIIVTELIRS